MAAADWDLAPNADWEGAPIPEALPVKRPDAVLTPESDTEAAADGVRPPDPDAIEVALGFPGLVAPPDSDA